MRWHLQLIGGLALMLLACDSTETRTNEPNKATADKPAQPADKPAQPADKPAQPADAQPGVAITTGSEPGSEDDAREQCIRDCVEAKKMEARAPEAIEADCSRTCEANPDPAAEAIPCASVDECWVSDTAPAQPIVRPKQLQGHKFEPCKDGELAPACVEGHCILVPHGC